MKKMLCALLGALLLSVFALAQTTEFVNGRLRANIGPQGETTSNEAQGFLEIQDGADWISLLFESGLLIGGIDANDELVLYTTRGASLEAGIRDLGVEVGSPWLVTGEQIAAHLADFNDNGVVDDPIFDIFAWPGTASAFSEEYNGFPLWDQGNIYRMAGFWDQTFNGSYTPQVGDYPIVFVRGCLDQEPRTIPAEMLFIPIQLRDANEQLIFDVLLTAFRFGCEEEDSVIGNTIFLHYQIINVSGSSFDDMYIGYWADGDLGCFTDDYFGVFPDRNTMYFYNARPEDADCEFVNDDRFAGTPAALAIDLLRGPLDETGVEVPLSKIMPIYNGSVIQSVPPATTEPVTIQEYYRYLSGRWRDGQPLIDQGIGYGGEGEQVSFPFTGDPATNTGWTEVGEGNPIADRKAIMSAGPFTMRPGAVNEFILAFTYSQDHALNNLEQVAALRDRVDIVQAFFDNCFDFTNGPFDICTPLLTAAEDLPAETNNQLLLYPNPASTQVNVFLPADASGTLQVFAADGRMLLQKRTLSDRVSLDLQDWPKGLYLLRWEGEREIRLNKLLVD